jgi:hypothetical protein
VQSLHAQQCLGCPKSVKTGINRSLDSVVEDGIADWLTCPADIIRRFPRHCGAKSATIDRQHEKRLGKSINDSFQEEASSLRMSQMRRKAEGPARLTAVHQH